jgi:N-acetylglucosamine transport system permease protein
VTAASQPVPKQKAGRRRRRRPNFDKISFMAVFLGVPLVIYVVFVISPFVQALYYSLTDWNGFSQTMHVIGLRNFRTLFTDALFRHALINNVILLIVVPILTLGIALVFATFVTVGGKSRGQVRGLKNSSFYRVISFFPYAIPQIVIGVIWAGIYDPSGGLLNGFLTGIGLDHFKNFAWLGKSSTALGASIFVMMWGLIGFYMVLFIAAIKGIPAELFESIRIDGAGRFKTAIHLTIPMIRDNVQTAWIYLGILALDAFAYMQALNPNGGPSNSTIVMVQVMFRRGFTESKFGLATAMGVVLAAVTLAFAAVVFIVSRLLGGDKER